MYIGIIYNSGTGIRQEYVYSKDHIIYIYILLYSTESGITFKYTTRGIPTYTIIYQCYNRRYVGIRA